MAKRIMNKWRGYTVADCDCKYCLYYGGRKNREVNCLADECVCKAELQEALADILRWLTGKGGKRNRCDCRVHIHFEESSVDAQDHHE